MAPSRLLLPSINAFRVLARSFTTSAAASPGFSYNSVPKTRPIAMANVTKANFWENYEQLVLHLQNADFVALDFEMTGVETTPWRRHSVLDTCNTRYLHIKHSAESFAVWQCGVCPFKWDDPGQKFIAYPFNFYIFPRNELPVEMPSRSYFSQTESLEFLAKHGFDFNKTIYNGKDILFIEEQEEMARQKLGLTEEAQKWRRLQAEMEAEVPLTRVGDVLFSEKIRVQLGQWRDGVLRNQQRWQWTDPGGVSSGRKTSVSDPEISKKERVSDGFREIRTGMPDASSSSYAENDRGSTYGSLSSQRPCYSLATTSHNQVRMVKQVIRKHFADLVAVVVDKPHADDRKDVRAIFTTSKEDRQKFEEELEEENRKKLEATVFEAVGFRKVIDAIEASRIPLIGHNCLLDLAHVHDKFLGPLPSNLRAFSASISRHFPCILDTKYLLKTEPTLREANSRSTSLAIVYQQLCQGFSDQAGIPQKFYNGKPKIVTKPMSRVKIETAKELQRYSGGTETGLKHEAGFDAYMTGAVFAQICHLLQVDSTTIRSLTQNSRSLLGSYSGFASYANLLMLQTFKGQLALDLRTGMEATGDRAPRGAHAPPHRLLSRENVVLVWGLPSKIQDHILRKMVQYVFSKEKRLSNVDIVHVDESSAFVEFRSSAIVESFMRAFEAALVNSSQINSPLDLRDFKVAKFAAYERVCSSPLSTDTLGLSADLLRISEFDDVVPVNYNKAVEITEVRTNTHQEASNIGSGVQTSEVNQTRFIEDGPRNAKEDLLPGVWSPEEGQISPDDTRSPSDGNPGGNTGKHNVDDGLIGSESEIPSSQIDTESADVQRSVGDGESNQRDTSSPSYSKWMKRVFDEDEAPPFPSSKKPWKRHKTLENWKEDGGS